ncbi:FecR family protein [Chitinophaga caseinilytica]|uniref:FecR family protein n=1 Tax=Chitinophaga caseinilytica TaxID=2267521 RepID=UPI003C2F59ED
MENENHIRILLNKELFGTITPEEQQALDDLLATSAKARAIRSEMRDPERYGGQSVFPAKELEADYFAVLQRHRRRRMQRIWNWWIGAGLTAGAAITALLIWPRDPAPEPPQAVIPAEIQEITLQFANGETLAFRDGGQQRYRVQSTGIVFENGTLHFESGTTGAPGWNSLNVPPGQETRLQLEDGTAIVLNSASKIQFPFHFGSGIREVYLEGEGYFRIAPAGNRPFVVHAGQADIRTKAGICNINAYTPTNVSAQIVNGMMEMEAGGVKVPVSAGEEATAATGKTLTAARMQDQYSLSWLKGEQFFRDLPAADVRDVIARWFNTTLYIDSREAEKKLLNGRIYRNQTLSEFVDNMNAQNEVEFYWKNGLLHCK